MFVIIMYFPTQHLRKSWLRITGLAVPKLLINDADTATELILSVQI